jgi:hypothetical protein
MNVRNYGTVHKWRPRLTNQIVGDAVRSRCSSSMGTSDSELVEDQHVAEELPRGDRFKDTGEPENLSLMHS